MWNEYGLELGWVGVAVLLFGFVLFLMDLVRRFRDGPPDLQAALLTEEDGTEPGHDLGI